MLGNVTDQVFDDFESTLEIRDPAMSMAKIRANAIETSSKIAISDQYEDLIRGWTFLSPSEPNSVRRLPLDECVVLLTDAALYRVNFDWNAEKVQSFDKIDLRNIKGLLKGTYITNTLSASQSDPERNIGFVVKYSPGASNLARMNTRSLNSAVSSGNGDAEDSHDQPDQSKDEGTSSTFRVLAFKALPASSAERQETSVVSEKESVNLVCEDIKRAVLGDQSEPMEFIENQDIISVQDAKKSTGLIEQWSHSLKKMVWA